MHFIEVYHYIIVYHRLDMTLGVAEALSPKKQ